MLAVMPPKEMFAPMLSMIRLNAPKITVRLIVGLMTLKSLQYSFFQKRHSVLISTDSRPSSTTRAHVHAALLNKEKINRWKPATEMKIVQTTLLGLLRKIA